MCYNQIKNWMSSISVISEMKMTVIKNDLRFVFDLKCCGTDLTCGLKAKVFSFDLFIDRTWLQLCKNHFLPQWLTSLNRKCSNVILTVMQSDLKDLQLLYEDLKSDLDSIYSVNVRCVDTELTSRVDVLWSEYTAVFAIVKAARRNFMSMPWIKNIM